MLVLDAALSQDAIRSVPNAVLSAAATYLYARFKTPAAAVGDGVVISLCDTSSSFRDYLSIEVVSGAIQFTHEFGGNDGTTTATPLAADTDYFVIGVLEQDSLKLYINGVLEDSFTGAVIDPDRAVDNLSVGSKNNNFNTVEYFTGAVAYAYWLSDLTTTELDGLNAGDAPSTIDPAKIEYGYDLVSDANIDAGIDSTALTLRNGPTFDAVDPIVTTQVIRKSSQFTVEETLAGTVVSATLNGNAITVDSHVGTTVTLTDTGSGITTSGEYPLVLTDNSATPQTETITLQVNVYGIAPSNNPVQKDGAALASLTGVQVRVTSGANINGTELYYSGTATTDASGNLGNIDLSSTAAADADPVLLHMRTAAGDNIIASETVGLI